MFVIWMLHMSVFVLQLRTTTADQCPLDDMEPGAVSPVMDSLQCYNDFKTHVKCTWEEEPRIHSHGSENRSSYSLYYRNSAGGEEILCDSLGPGVALSNGKVRYSCRYNTERFSYFTSHTLYFNVSCKSKAITLSVAQHGKVLAPTDLTEKQADGRSHLLSWKSPYPASSNITRTLTYQLQYRRSGQDWTTVDNVSASEYMIGKQSPGYLYQARVRARGAVGLWSNWSPLVSWRTQNDEAFNLQCVIEGETNVMCSWQMKTEHSHFISYHLWYNDSTQAFARCENPVLKSTNAGVSEFICLINTSDPYMLTAELRPVHHSREFSTSKNIQLPRPDPVTVKEADGIFKVNWSPPTSFDLNEFFVQLQVSSDKTSVIYDITSKGVFEIPFSSLHSSTNYTARIRALLRAASSYKGQPSEWSEPTQFTTGPASWSIITLIYVLISVFVAVIFVILYNALPVCHRRIELWKGSIPSPTHSRVIEGILKKSSAGWPYLQSEKDKTSVCVLQATESITICKNSISGEPLLLHSEDVSSDLTSVKRGWSDGSNHSCSYVGEGMFQDKSGISFSGPYILCCEENCCHNETFMSSDEGPAFVSGISEISGPTNGGYVVTPPTTSPVTQDPAPTNCSTNNPSDEPPAYTPRIEQGGLVHPHPSGYFMMPCAGTSQSEPRGYVALSQSVT